MPTAAEAAQDLLRSFGLLLDQHVFAAECAEDAIASAIKVLEILPFTCRKAIGASGSPVLRELIPIGGSG